jgi:SPP1 gp7 family putative phage head morphogenesis protein
MSAAGVLYNVNEFAAAFFKRGAIKATILTVEGNPPQAERERLKAWWQRFFTGINKAFAAEVVSAAVTPVIVGEGLSELTNTELTATEREEIATALGVPHSLVMSNAANYATAEADRLTFYDMTIVPQANVIARQVNAQLFAPAGLRFEWHPQELAIYQADENERATAYATYVGAQMKPSIAAQIVGLQLPEGVEPEDLDPEPQPVQLQTPPQTEPETQEGEQPAPDTEQRRQDEARKFLRWAKGKRAPDVGRFVSDVLTDDDKRALLAGETKGAQDGDDPELPFDISHGSFTHDGYKALLLQLDRDDDEAEQRIRMALEKRTARELGRVMSDMLETLYPDGWGGDWTNAEAEAVRAHNAFLAEQRLKDALSRALLDGVDLGISVGVQQLENVGFGFDWTLAHIPARDWAIAHTDEVLRQMAGVTQRGVGQSIARWLENGEPLDVLKRDLSPFFGPARAERIAATEVTRAAAEGSETAYRESGVVAEMEWASSMDERVCPICSGLTGKRRKFGEPFSLGIPKPPAHVNCRCWVRPVIQEPEQ